MPKSKRARVYHLTQVSKKTREQKDKLFSSIRECIPQYQHCFAFSVDNMRNNYLKEVRHELSDCRMFFGKTKLTARALGTTPEDAQADGIDGLARHLTGAVGVLFTNRDPEDIISYFDSLSHVDFARAGTVAPRTVTVPPGVVYSTGGEVPPENDVPIAHTLEPELRRLGMPTRMVKGKVCLGADESGEGRVGGYTICKEGDVLDSRQTRLLKLFGICLSEFRVALLAYWSASTGNVTDLEAGKQRLARLQQQGKAGAKDNAKEEGDEMDEDEEEDQD
ncbi:ribosomal protein L10-domain-containing protein [Thermothelomyces heterothallicus CBS 202.75]|uniref:ribosomal protein L10-domain-containing protein n=1 Tax=Thermothelomyces heterothallicus CBS 202.75 TaxID=1149848 RepID=UPI003743BA17